MIVCPSCQSTNIGGHGLSAEGKTRYKCHNPECKRCTFILNYTYQGYLPEVKEKITDMAMNGSGIRDTARVLKISPSTVINEIKKKVKFVICEREKVSKNRAKSDYNQVMSMGRARSGTR
jgi:transposase-like protein